MYKDVAFIISGRLSEIFDKHNYTVDIQLVNNYKCIRVEAADTLIWIRLLEVANKVYVDINNIELASSHRREGILTEICESLKSITGIKRIVISSVCSAEMHNFVRSITLREMTVWVVIQSLIHFNIAYEYNVEHCIGVYSIYTMFY